MRELSNAASERTAAALTRVADAQAAVSTYQAGEYAELKDLVTTLAERGSAASEELDDVYQRVSGAEDKIDTLLGRLTSVSEDLVTEKGLRVQADAKLGEASEKIAAKEAEADQLRQQFEDQKVTAAAFEANAKENFTVAQKSVVRAAKMEGQRNLVIKVLAGVAGLLLISLLMNYIQFRSKSILPI